MIYIIDHKDSFTHNLVHQFESFDDVECDNFNVDLSKWNMENVTTTRGMFGRCYSFQGIGLNNWDTSNINNAKDMFYNCNNFNADLSNWDVTNFDKIEGMFRGCTSFTGIGLSRWNWNNTNKFSLGKMFAYCKNLDLYSDFNISNWKINNC